MEDSRGGTLYVVGLGPGDPELVSVKASRLLGRLEHIDAPKADATANSVARVREHQQSRPYLSTLLVDLDGSRRLRRENGAS